MLIRESLKEGTISKSFLDNSFKIGNILKLEKDRLVGVFDFLVG
jgi:hypothetical protein